jgi:hypothetical protein
MTVNLHVGRHRESAEVYVEPRLPQPRRGLEDVLENRAVA